jgi:hypothetical protein
MSLFTKTLGRAQHDPHQYTMPAIAYIDACSVRYRSVFHTVRHSQQLTQVILSR